MSDHSFSRTASNTSTNSSLQDDDMDAGFGRTSSTMVVPLLLLGRQKVMLSKGEMEWNETLSKERRIQRLKTVQTAFQRCTLQAKHVEEKVSALKCVKRVGALLGAVRAMHNASTVIQKHIRGRQARNLKQELESLEGRLRDKVQRCLPARQWLTTAEEIPQVLPTMEHLLEYSFEPHEKEYIAKLLHELETETNGTSPSPHLGAASAPPPLPPQAHPSRASHHRPRHGRHFADDSDDEIAQPGVFEPSSHSSTSGRRKSETEKQYLPSPSTRLLVLDRDIRFMARAIRDP